MRSDDQTYPRTRGQHIGTVNCQMTEQTSKANVEKEAGAKPG